MSTYLLIEAALRSLIMGAIILAALRLLRIHQVRAQRVAWLLALCGALAMPALVYWHIGPRLLPEFSAHSELLPAAISPTAQLSALPVAESLTVITAPASEPGPQFSVIAATVAKAAVAFSFMMSFALLVRLFFGIGFAFRLRNRARRVPFPFAARSDIRISSQIATPVTIASTVLLPKTYSSWNESTLRVVLSHECAHVRQRDFYIQLLTGLHCSIFWFSPYSWWLQRQLSELGEALSDRAAVEQAHSRASYAEILLEFATRARWPSGGVAMARSGSLTPRIERLLNDRGFERCFTGSRRSAVIAAGVVLLAMLASTSLVRVQAAAVAESEPSAALPATPPIPAAPAAPISTEIEENTEVSHHGIEIHSAHNGEILAIHSGDSRVTFDSGERLPPINGDYIYYQHEGKPYVIQDPGVIAKAQALLAPMQELGRKQQELGRKQQELGRQQSILGQEQKTLGMRQLAAKVDAPDFRKNIAELESVMRKMDLEHVAAQIDEKALLDLQSRLGEIQGRVGALQAELGSVQSKYGEQQGVLGEKQGALGEKQGALGEQQRLLGEQQRKIVDAARTQLKPVIDQAIRDGKAKPLTQAY